MSLLNRIAISNGNPRRKEVANRHVLRLEHKIEDCWNQQLRLEIEQKRKRFLPIVHPPPVPHSKSLASRIVSDLEHEMEERWHRQLDMVTRNKRKRFGASNRLLRKHEITKENLPLAH